MDRFVHLVSEQSHVGAIHLNNKEKRALVEVEVEASHVDGI